jgi:hypothetical protein
LDLVLKEYQSSFTDGNLFLELDLDLLELFFSHVQIEVDQPYESIKHYSHLFLVDPAHSIEVSVLFVLV